MGYLRKEKPDSNLKKADICGVALMVWRILCNFTVKNSRG